MNNTIGRELVRLTANLDKGTSGDKLAIVNSLNLKIKKGNLTIHGKKPLK